MLKYIVFVFLFSFYSCQKRPEANFVSDKDSYIKGETIRIINTSNNSSKFKWTLPDGKRTNSVNVNYYIDSLNKDSVFYFRLKAYGIKKHVVSVKTKAIKVN
jgi:hypothetical protein